MEKFGRTVQEIEQRKKMYLELAEKHSSMGDLESGAGGYGQQQQLSDDTIKIMAATDFQQQIIDQRQQQFDMAENIMSEINQIAGQINTQTKEQGKQLVRTDMQMDVVVDNTEKAHKEIVEAQSYQKSTGKWLCYLLMVIAVILAIILIIVFTK